jgi:hypothetical protein
MNTSLVVFRINLGGPFIYYVSTFFLSPTSFSRIFQAFVPSLCFKFSNFNIKFLSKCNSFVLLKKSSFYEKLVSQIRFWAIKSDNVIYEWYLSIKWLLSVSALEFAISLALSRTFSTWVASSSFSLTSRNCSWFSLTSEASLASISSLSWSNWWLRTRSLPLRSAISSCASVRLLARPIRKEFL